MAANLQLQALPTARSATTALQAQENHSSVLRVNIAQLQD